MDFSEGQLRSLEKIIEMKGGFKSAPDFLSQASMMQQVIAGTGGMVKPSDYLAFIKTAGVAGRQLDNKSFYYGMEPLIQEMGGNRVGTGLMSAYNNLAQGRSTVRAAREMMKLGIIDPSMVEYNKIGEVKSIQPGALKNMGGYTSNPFQWMQDTLLPAMRARGITSESGILNEMGSLFGNRTASSLFSLMFLQQEKIAKNMKLSQGAMGTDELVKLARSGPQGAEMALGKAWENLKIATGEALIPIIIPAMNKLAEAFRVVGHWAYAHPRMFDALIYGFAGLSAALLFSGSVLVLKAAFMGLSILVPALAGTITATVIPALAALSAVLIPLAAIAYHEDIANAIDGSAPGIGDALMNARNFLRGDYRHTGYAPPPSGKSTTVHTQVNLDGRQIANVVSGHQSDSGRSPLASTGGFDGRLHPNWGF